MEMGIGLATATVSRFSLLARCFPLFRPFADIKLIALFTRACTNIELGVIGE